MITVSGLPWQGDYHSPAKCPTGSLIGKVLCTNHNSALSPLDEIAKKLAVKLGNVPNIFRDPGIGKDCLFYLFNGHDIERWILKILCGVIFSGNAAFRDNPIPKLEPSLGFLRVLFGSESLPRGWGLYFLGRIGDRFEAQRNFTFAPIIDDHRILGCIVSVHQFQFLLAMSDPPDDFTGTLLEGAIYRPCCIQINDINTLFKWGKVKSGSLIYVSLYGPEFRFLPKLKKYLYQGASHGFEAFLKGNPGNILNLF